MSPEGVATGVIGALDQSSGLLTSVDFRSTVAGGHSRHTCIIQEEALVV